MIRLNYVTAAALLLLAVQATAADCPDTSGAQLAQLSTRDSEQRLMQTLSPSWRGDEKMRLTWFGAYVSRTGEVKDSCCWTSTIQLSSDGAERLQDKLTQLRLQPATVDGVAVEVFVGFTVVGLKTADGIVSRLLPNQLWSREEFGSGYIAPQRIGQINHVSARVRGEIAVDVDATGKAIASSVHNWDQGSKSRQEHLLDMMRDQCFIPGSVDGKPTAMRYIERFQEQ